MNFASPIFLFAFLPLTAALYALLRKPALKNALLVAAGLVFYAFGDLRHLPLLLASCVLHYAVGRWLCACTRGRRAILAGCIVLDLAVLGAYKFFGALPLGISFYTFQAISFVVDVYRTPESGTKSFWRVLQYLTFFPQLTAGPLMKFSAVQPYLEARQTTWGDAYDGICRFAGGLFKKVLLSAAAAELANAVYGQTGYDALCAWTGAACYCLQLYFDFSGYSDMAIGLGLLFGVRLPENFRDPYCASSITDFWRRWHISLSAWFRDYLYIPLGGSRNGLLRTMGNKMVVFLATGLWHGSGLTFLLWGVWHGLWSCVETALKLPQKLRGRWYGHLYALLVVVLGFALFRAASLSQAAALMRAMFMGLSANEACRAALAAALNARTLTLCALGVLLCLPVGALWKIILSPRGAAIVRGVLALVLFALCLMAMSAGAFQPFIYAAF